MVYRHLTLFHFSSLWFDQYEGRKKWKTRWNVTMKSPRTLLFPETQFPSNPSSLHHRDILEKTTHHKVILLHQTSA